MATDGFTPNERPAEGVPRLGSTPLVGRADVAGAAGLAELAEVTGPAREVVTTAADREPHPLVGVRPRSAVCERCGYQVGGIAIDRAGQIVCPECAWPTSFGDERLAARLAEATRGHTRRRGRLLVLIGLLGLGLGAAAVATGRPVVVGAGVVLGVVFIASLVRAARRGRHLRRPHRRG